MDGAKLQAKINAGYAQAAKRVGLDFARYRPTGAANPLDAANLIGSVKAHFRVDDRLTKWSDYGNPQYSAWVDGSAVAVGDILVGATGTYFIAAMQPLLPIMAVQCERVITVKRPGAAAALMTGWPASILQSGTGGRSNRVSYPGAVPEPRWAMLFLAVAGVALEIADTIIDDLGRVYSIDSAELTGYGWRVIATQIPLPTAGTIAARKAIIDLTGKTIVFRRVTKASTGANPPINPVDGTFTVSAAALAGASSVSITGTNKAAGFIEAGDVLTIAGADYTATTRAIGASGVYSVAITPPLVSGVAIGAAAAMKWGADRPVKAMVETYASSLIDGTTITARDLKVVMSTEGVDGAALPVPTTVDKIVIDGASRAIGIISAEYVGETVAAWEIQAKG